MTPDHAIIALAAQAARRAKLAILSNNGLLVRDHLDALCPTLSPLFSGRVFCSAEFGIGKPEPAIFRRCPGRLGLEPGSVLFIDDKAGNFDAARDAGLQAHQHRDAAGLHAALRAFDLLEDVPHAS